MEILSILKNKGDAIAFTGSGQLVEYYTQFPVTTGAICRLSGYVRHYLDVKSRMWVSGFTLHVVAETLKRRWRH